MKILTFTTRYPHAARPARGSDINPIAQYRLPCAMIRWALVALEAPAGREFLTASDALSEMRAACVG